jgi:dihydroneopterin aldolase
MGRIAITGLRAVGTHGVLPEEQERAQPFEVDLVLDVDVSRAAASDDLGDTVDYGTLAERVAAVVATEHHRLLERLATRIAELAKSDPRVDTVTVTVRKLRPPVPVVLEHVSVTVEA